MMPRIGFWTRVMVGISMSVFLMGRLWVEGVGRGKGKIGGRAFMSWLGVGGRKGRRGRGRGRGRGRRKKSVVWSINLVLVFGCWTWDFLGDKRGLFWGGDLL